MPHLHGEYLHSFQMRNLPAPQQSAHAPHVGLLECVSPLHCGRRNRSCACNSCHLCRLVCGSCLGVGELRIFHVRTRTDPHVGNSQRSCKYIKALRTVTVPVTALTILLGQCFLVGCSMSAAPVRGALLAAVAEDPWVPSACILSGMCKRTVVPAVPSSTAAECYLETIHHEVVSAVLWAID